MYRFYGFRKKRRSDRVFFKGIGTTQMKYRDGNVIKKTNDDPVSRTSFAYSMKSVHKYFVVANSGYVFLSEKRMTGG